MYQVNFVTHTVLKKVQWNDGGKEGMTEEQGKSSIAPFIQSGDYNNKYQLYMSELVF